jgi:hypothetical protein
MRAALVPFESEIRGAICSPSKASVEILLAIYNNIGRDSWKYYCQSARAAFLEQLDREVQNLVAHEKQVNDRLERNKKVTGDPAYDAYLKRIRQKEIEIGLDQTMMTQLKEQRALSEKRQAGLRQLADALK